MKKMITIIAIFLLIICTLCGCSIEDLKWDDSQKEENKEEKYENWMVDSGISLDGKLLSYEATTSNGKIKIEYGNLKRKGYSYFSIKSKDNHAVLYKKQDMYYLNLNKNWEMSSIEEESKDIIDSVIQSLTGNIENKIEVLENEYSKTVDDDGDIYDVINIIVVDKEKQKKMEEEYQQSLKVKDDGEYGNDIQVIINDGGKREKEEDIPTIKLKAYIDTETNELVKIQWPINGSKATFKIKELDDKIPKSALDSPKRPHMNFAEDFESLVGDMLQ